MDERTTKILFEFDSLFDIKNGYIRYLINSKASTKYFKSFMNHPSINMLKNLYVSSNEENPLKWVLNDEYIDSADSLLEELKVSKARAILNNAIATDVYKLYKLYNTMSSAANTKCVINCASEEEAKIINSFNKEFSTEINETNLSNYNCLYVSTTDKITKYKDTFGKHIYIHNIRLNYDDELRLNTKLSKYIDHAIFHTVDPYIGITLFLDKIKRER